MQLSVILLLTLAATSIIGTVIPQNEDPVRYFQAYGEFLYRFFSILDFFDMYQSWWFRLLMLLLTANIVVCSIERLTKTRKVLFVKKPTFHADRFRRLENKERFRVAAPPEQLEAGYTGLMAREFRAVEKQETKNGYMLFGERGRWTRLGVYFVHLSILFLLVGGLIGSIFGFESFVTIPEGEGVDRVQPMNKAEIFPLGFEIRCDDFDITYYPSGQPSEYRSSLTILENGKAVVQKDIVVNDPLRYRGINIFQSSWGELPQPDAHMGDPGNRAITLNFTNRHSGMTYQRKAALGVPVTMPEGKGTFVLGQYVDNAQFRGQGIGEALVGTWTPKTGEPVDVLLPLAFQNFDKMRGDEIFIHVDGEAIRKSGKMEKRYYTGLQITRDPGVGVVYSGFIFMIFGCVVAFFLRHEQISVEVEKKGVEAIVTVSGFANKNRPAMNRKVSRFAAMLQTRGVQPEASPEPSR